MITAINLSDRRRVVTTRDPAIDEAKSDLKTYAKTLDLSVLQFKAGEVPTFFTLRPLSSSEYDRLMQSSFRTSNATEEERGYIVTVGAARQGVAKIENFPAEGEVREFKHGLTQEVADIIDTATTIELGHWVTRLTKPHAPAPEAPAVEQLEDEGK